jgi:hypothetical protein
MNCQCGKASDLAQLAGKILPLKDGYIKPCLK